MQSELDVDSLRNMGRKDKEKDQEIERLNRLVSSFSQQRRSYSLDCSASNTIRFGVISDIHTGSLYERFDALHKFYDFLKSEHIQQVFCPGDVLDGHKIYRGQEFEDYALGFDEQIKAFCAKMPRIKGLQVQFIAGNHDTSFKKQSGVSIGEAIEARRSDWHYLGDDFATIALKTKVGKQLRIQLLHPDGGTAYALCFDDCTEILTEKRGWLKFEDLLPDDRVATMNPETHAFEWQLPTAHTNEPYNGKMYHFKSRTVDLCVTPNHRLYVRRYDGSLHVKKSRRNPCLRYPTKSHPKVDYNWGFKTADELATAKRQRWQLTRITRGWNGKTKDTIDIPFRVPKKYASTKITHVGKVSVYDLAELLAWYVTEGSISKKHKQTSISQSLSANPKNHARIVELCKKLGVKPRVTDRYICINSVEVCDYLYEQCGCGSRNKHLPQWLKDQGCDVLKVVFDTMIKGDGWKNGASYGYKSISKALRDDISEIAHKLGYATTEHKESINVSTVQHNPTINTRPVVLDYSGRVYCVTVPNQIILVRRNGRSILSGNSYRAQKIIESFSGGTKPHIVLIGHLHKAELIPSYRNVISIMAGTFQSQTPFMKRKPTPAHVGGWIVEIVVGTNKDLVSRCKAEFISFYEPGEE